MLIIRFQRVGKKNQAIFRIVLAEKHRAASKKVNEILGSYNPRGKQFNVKDPERVKYWLGQHVEVSATAHNLLVDKGFITAPKKHAWTPKKKEQAAAAPEAAAPAEPKAEETKTESAEPAKA